MHPLFGAQTYLDNLLLLCLAQLRTMLGCRCMEVSIGRFDSPFAIGAFVATTVLSLLIGWRLWRFRRSGVPLPRWIWGVFFLVHVAVDKIYVPIGPLIALVAANSARANMPPTDVATEALGRGESPMLSSWPPPTVR